MIFATVWSLAPLRDSRDWIDTNDIFAPLLLRLSFHRALRSAYGRRMINRINEAVAFDWILTSVRFTRLRLHSAQH
jgi:hypothetical protein